MPRRCTTCSTAATVHRVDGADACVVCDLLEQAETRDAGARALHDLLIATYDLRARQGEPEHVVATSGALELAIESLENDGRNLRYVARCVARTLEPHRRARRGARA